MEGLNFPQIFIDFGRLPQIFIEQYPQQSSFKYPVSAGKIYLQLSLTFFFIDVSH